MEHQHNVGSHALIGDDDFLTAIDDKVPSLIKNTLLSIFGYLFVVQAPKLAELRSDHDGDLAQEDLHLGLNFQFLEFSVTSLYLADLNAIDLKATVVPDSPDSLAVLIFLDVNLLKLPHLDVDIDLSGVSQVPEARLMRIDRFVALVSLLDAGEGIHADLIEADFIPNILLGRLAYRQT